MLPQNFKPYSRICNSTGLLSTVCFSWTLRTRVRTWLRDRSWASQHRSQTKIPRTARAAMPRQNSPVWEMSQRLRLHSDFGMWKFCRYLIHELPSAEQLCSAKLESAALLCRRSGAGTAAEQRRQQVQTQAPARSETLKETTGSFSSTHMFWGRWLAECAPLTARVNLPLLGFERQTANSKLSHFYASRLTSSLTDVLLA